MKAIQTQTDSGQTIFIEITEDFDVVKGPQGGGTVADVSELATNMMEKLEDVGTTIADVCRSVQNKAIKTLDDSMPAELTLQFGVKLGGQAGIPFITKGAIEGTFQVTAKWEYK